METLVRVRNGQNEHRPGQIPHKVFLPPTIQRHSSLCVSPQAFNGVSVYVLVAGVDEVNGVVDSEVVISFVL